MLSYDEDDGILWLHPLFSATLACDTVEQHSIVCTIDDCDCDECNKKRGPIEFLSSVLLYVPSEFGMIMQRLSPSEARTLGNSLISYANDIDAIKEELNDD